MEGSERGNGGEKSKGGAAKREGKGGTALKEENQHKNKRGEKEEEKIYGLGRINIDKRGEARSGAREGKVR